MWSKSTTWHLGKKRQTLGKVIFPNRKTLIPFECCGIVLEYKFFDKIHRYLQQHPTEYLHVKQNGAISSHEVSILWVFSRVWNSLDGSYGELYVVPNEEHKNSKEKIHR